MANIVREKEEAAARERAAHDKQMTEAASRAREATAAKDWADHGRQLAEAASRTVGGGSSSVSCPDLLRV